MTETTKIPIIAATMTGAVENGPVSQTAHASTIDFITPAGERQPFHVADLLLPGVENAISRRDLMSLTGYRDRELRLMIEAERRQGTPILSDTQHGYFLPATQMERDRCVASFRHRAKEIEATARAIEKAVLPG